MAQQASKKQSSSAAPNDVASLFSRFSEFSSRARYREVVMQDAAVEAALRWPMLAEIEGMERAPADPAAR